MNKFLDMNFVGIGYDDMKATAYLYIGKSYERLEEYEKALKNYANVIVKYDKKASKEVVNSAKQGIDRIIKIDIEEDTDTDENGNVTVNLAATPKYPDGTDFIVLGNHKWEWELKGGEGDLTANENLAKLDTTVNNLCSITIKAKLTINLGEYTGKSKRNLVNYILKKLFPIGPLKEIRNKNKDYLIYDVEGYEKQENILYPGMEYDLPGVTKIEPVAYKHGEICTLEVKFAPSKEFDKCNVKYEIYNNEGNIVINSSENQEFNISPIDETKGILKILIPNELGKYKLKLLFKFSKQEEKRGFWNSNTSTVQELYVLYDKPKYGDKNNSDDLYRLYRLPKNNKGFVKRNIKEVLKWLGYYSVSNSENYTEKVQIATKIHKYIILNIRKFKDKKSYWGDPFYIVFNKQEGSDCITHAMLMVYSLNILGIKATIKKIGPFDLHKELSGNVKVFNSNGQKLILAISTRKDANIFYEPMSRELGWEAICHLESENSTSFTGWDDDIGFDLGISRFIGTLREFREWPGKYVEKYFWLPIDQTMPLPVWVEKLHRGEQK